MHEQTTEEKAETLRLTLSAVLQHMGPATLEVIEAHIAALTAERDELKQAYNKARDMNTEQREEMRALRERVTALEELAAAAELAKETAESHLAAIRQRAGDASAIEAAYVGHHGGIRDSFLAVARYILGDDAPAPSETSAERVARICAMPEARIVGAIDPAPSEMDGLRGEMAEATRCAGCWKAGVDLCAVCEAEAKRSQDEMAEADCDVDGKGRAALVTTPVEPTTAEAFATVRHGCGVNANFSERAAAADALSLLERRMGAQEAAIRGALESYAHGRGMADAVNHLRAALTDAPPVFTLEVIKAAMQQAGLCERDRDAVEVLLHTPVP